MYEIIKSFRAHDEGGNNMISVFYLVFIGHHSFFDQGDDAVGEHLGMDTQPFMIFHSLERGVGNGADAHLKRCAVVD